MNAVTDTYPTPEHGWTCFHCGETFPPTMEGQVNARRHFGFDVHATPGCIEKLQSPERSLLLRVRALQEGLRRYREEDTKLYRRIASLESELWSAARRAEEQGYARGLADARAESNTPQGRHSSCESSGDEAQVPLRGADGTGDYRAPHVSRPSGGAPPEGARRELPYEPGWDANGSPIEPMLNGGW